ncbi:serine/threonine-protein kinase [Frankia sp. Cas4]|uniref:serine/threonine-protein kinase n=1 Tax=Frankia sp. Cas4 TaxID=3073927 RepID=UPI002AD2338F|nr:serine/threonine-protein kinase [Frankia sp. Cas4]
MPVDRERVAAALPDYDVGDELGRGGFGAVLAGRHRLIRRDVAIKVLHEHTSGAEDIRERFVAEARVLAGLDHPHVVRVYDYVERDGLCLLVMEKLTGGSLRQRFASGLSQPGACAIGLAAATALAAAHAKGVLHRDVKPDNLLFTDTGLLKVADFGIAKILEATATTTTGLVGTPRYMAPEQIAGDRLSPATDLYALGLVVYELLAGRPPFEKNLTVAAILHHHLNVAPAPLIEAPAAIAAVIGRALAKNPLARQASAQEFAVDLAVAAAGAFGPGWLTAGEVPTTLPDVITAAARDGVSANTTNSGPFTVRAAADPVPVPVPNAGPNAVLAARLDAGPNPTRRQPGPRRLLGVRRNRIMAAALAAALVATGAALALALTFADSGPRPGTGAYAGDTLVYELPLAAGLAIDRNGNIIIANAILGRVITIDPAGHATWLAGSPPQSTTTTPTSTAPSTTRPPNGTEPVSPTAAQKEVIDQPVAVAVGPDGSVYVVSGASDGQVFAIERSGAITVVAGTGPKKQGFTGNNRGNATSAELSYPQGVAVDRDGNILITEGTRVRRVSADGKIDTIAGTGGPTGRGGSSGDGGPATQALLTRPTDIAVAGDGSIYILDTGTRTVRKIDPKGIITRVAGKAPPTGASTPSTPSTPSATPSPPAIGSIGDGSPATDVALDEPDGITLAPNGDLYIAEYGTNAIRLVSAATGRISTVAGAHAATVLGDGGDAREARVYGPTGVAVDATGAVYVAQYDGLVRRIAGDGSISTVLKHNQ